MNIERRARRRAEKNRNGARVGSLRSRKRDLFLFQLTVYSSSPTRGLVGRLRALIDRAASRTNSTVSPLGVIRARRRLDRVVGALTASSFPLQRGDILEHVIDARRFRTVVTRRIIGRLAHVDHLDDAVVDVHGESFASLRSELRARSRRRQFHTQSLGHQRVRIGDKRDVTSLDLLILRPRPHDGGVVDAHDQHFVDPRALQSILSREISRDLTRGSRGRERAG